MVLLTSCDVASGEAPCGPVCRCNWDGMQEARGSNPLSSTLPDTRPCATRARAGERALPQPPSSDSAATSAAGTPLILRRGIRRHSG